MKITHFSISDTGLKRKNNEDYLLVDEKRGLFLLADGMGGHMGGEIASKLALESVHHFFEEHETSSDEEINRLQPYPVELPLAGRKLVYSIIRANTIVTETAQLNSALNGMGTTIVAVMANQGDLFAAHVGDSRIYMLHDGKFTQITDDHSLYYDELKRGILSVDVLETMPFRDRLTRALGHMEKAKVDMKVIHPSIGDVFLLCSDGLTDMVENGEMGAIVARDSGDLDKCGGALLKKALDCGGRDNISIVLLRVDEL